MPKRRITLVADIPADVSIEDWISYVMDAVGSWKGQLHPDNSLRLLDRASLRVSLRSAQGKTITYKESSDE